MGITTPPATDALISERTSTQQDTRAKLLAAAARVYAQYGYAGATTRLIAREAEVNEVTLFRLFRSKDALVDEAVRVHALGEIPHASLPLEPVDPERELVEWCAVEIARLRGTGELVRQCFAAAEEHPEHLREAAAGITMASRVLKRYVEEMTLRGMVPIPEHSGAATSLLVTALVSDALAREYMPEVYPRPASTAPRAYVRAFLASLGIKTSSGDSRFAQ